MLEFDRGLPSTIGGQAIHWEESTRHTRAVREQVEQYFAGERREFDLPLDLRGTEFRRRCWEQLVKIPYGETCTYADIARAVGSPNGFRAVGQANHYNPVAIIVPCHRVLAGGKYLGGYGGGLPVKKFLLQLEGSLFYERKADARSPYQLAFTEALAASQG